AHLRGAGKTTPLFNSRDVEDAVPYIRPLRGNVRVGGDAYIAPPYIKNGVFFYAAGCPEAIPYIRPLDGFCV
ncbi:MAG: hypothetical protein ACI4NU_08775, partial [Christensenellales bacterium]